MAAIDKFRKLFDKTTTQKGEQWLEKIPAWLGRKDGTINTGFYGLIYVRTADGQVLQVFNNNKVDLKFNLLVLIGRHKDEPNIWQIVSKREAWDAPAGSGIQYHHEQHEFLGPDMVMLDRRQIIQLSCLVKDAAGFIIQVYGAFVRTANGVVKIASQQIDLSSYVQSVGAIFVNIEVDDDGAVSINEGSNFGSPFIAQVSDIPTPDEGKYILAVILLYEGQTELSNDDIRVPMPLGVLPKSTGLQIGEAVADTPADGDKFGFWDIVDDVLKSITWANIKAALKTYFDTLYVTTETIGKYRQFVYEVDGGDLIFLTDEDGYPLFNLEDLE